MTKKVFRTHTGRVAVTARTCINEDCDCEAGKAMTAHRFLPPHEAAKLSRMQERAALPLPRSTQRVLNSAADRVQVEDFSLVAAIRARSEA